MKKLKFDKIILLFLIIVTFIKILVFFSKGLPLETSEIEKNFYLYSLSKIDLLKSKDFINFGINKGYLLFLLPNFTLTIFSLVFNNLEIAWKILSVLSYLTSIIYLFKITNHIFKKRNFSFLSVFVYLISPWSNYLLNSNLNSNVSILFSFIFLFSLLKNEFKIILRSLIYLIAILFTSIQGLIFSFLIILTSFFLDKKNHIKKRAGLILIILFLVVVNRNYFLIQFKHSFLSSLKPQNLSFEINERQKIDFLSTEKKYILPALFRKITYNKPLTMLNKSINQTISFFDIEQMSLPQSSYEILKLSGLGPKGNFQLLYFWEILLMPIGIYLAFKFEKKIIYLSIIGLIPSLLFSKIFFLSNSGLLYPYVFLFSIFGINSFIKIIKKKVLYIFFGYIVLLAFFYHTDFYCYKEKTITSHPYFLKEISTWLKNNPTEKNVYVTNRFGPTDLSFFYYLKKSPQIYWQNYLKGNLISYENYNFLFFDLKNNEVSDNSIYIGLEGEYLGKGKNFDEKNINSKLTLQEKIIGDEEPVFEYGNQIWITEIYENK